MVTMVIRDVESLMNVVETNSHFLVLFKRSRMFCVHIDKEKPIHTLDYLYKLTPFCGILKAEGRHLYSRYWQINTASIMSVNITFLQFHLPNTGHQCIACNLQISVPGVSDKYCGYKLPWSVFQTGKILYDNQV